MQFCLNKLCSLPFVEILLSFDALEGPEIVLVQLHAFGVPSAESLSDPSVVESLSVAELEVASEEPDCETESESLEDASVVEVEVESHVGGLTSVVLDSEETTEGSIGERKGASEDCVHVAGVEELEVEVIGVVLDELDELDLAEQL